MPSIRFAAVLALPPFRRPVRQVLPERQLDHSDAELLLARRSSTKFDVASGRYDYTVDVNALFSRFETGLLLQNGRIRGTTCSPR
jgi:hypothetical protein